MAAVAVVCAVTVFGGAGTAFAGTFARPAAHVRAPAAPDPGPAPSPSASASASPGPAAGAGVDDKDLESVRKRLDSLYHDAAVATEKYNAAKEKADQQSAALDKLTDRIADVGRQLDDLHDRAGAAARAQYRDAGLPPEARLWLSDDPQQFLDGVGRLREGQRATQGLIAESRRTQSELRRYRRDAARRWKQLEADRKAKATAQHRIEQRIKSAEQLEDRLEKEQKKALAALEAKQARQAQTAWLQSGAFTDLSRRATGAAKRAVRFATDQIGKPYVWGAEGPGSYDCSGLTSQAWAHAGRVIPRTSQEQWRQLPHVPVSDMRPGDLIIYFDDATHVGMYVGNGMIVHAPRPGRTVTMTGAGTMPILGVVRPTAG